MEKSTAPRARFIAAILLFAAVVIGDLILSRGYLAQGPATWPVFLLLELVMLALLVIGGILFCNRRGLDTNKKLILGFGFFLVWCILTVIFFADYKALYLSTLHTEYPSYGAAITCLKLVLVLCGLTALIPVAPAPTGRAYADGLARAYFHLIKKQLAGRFCALYDESKRKPGAPAAGRAARRKAQGQPD